MRLRYDLHVHSALSPCAEDDMTPVNIVGFAKINGLDMVAVADHNAIGNVEVAMRAGAYYGVTVVPAFELQTAEDIHLLCLFGSFEELSAFHKSVTFQKVKNNPRIFGRQLLYDEDDEVTGEWEDLLLTSSTLSAQDAYGAVWKAGGIAVPAHIDREANGMVQILGAVPEEFGAVELSTRATSEEIARYAAARRVIVDSDAHTLDAIGLNSTIELAAPSAQALVDMLKGVHP